MDERYPKYPSSGRCRSSKKKPAAAAPYPRYNPCQQPRQSLLEQYVAEAHTTYIIPPCCPCTGHLYHLHNQLGRQFPLDYLPLTRDDFLLGRTPTQVGMRSHCLDTGRQVRRNFGLNPASSNLTRNGFLDQGLTSALDFSYHHSSRLRQEYRNFYSAYDNSCRQYSPLDVAFRIPHQIGRSFQCDLNATPRAVESLEQSNATVSPTSITHNTGVEDTAQVLEQFKVENPNANTSMETVSECNSQTGVYDNIYTEEENHNICKSVDSFDEGSTEKDVRKTIIPLTEDAINKAHYSNTMKSEDYIKNNVHTSRNKLLASETSNIENNNMEPYLESYDSKESSSVYVDALETGRSDSRQYVEDQLKNKTNTEIENYPPSYISETTDDVETRTPSSEVATKLKQDIDRTITSKISVINSNEDMNEGQNRNNTNDERRESIEPLDEESSHLQGYFEIVLDEEIDKAIL